MFTYVDQKWSNQLCRAPEGRNSGGKTGRNPDGTFAPGNPGKPKGSRHKATQAVQQLLDDEAEALTRKAVEMALDGDGTALRLCLERIAPARKDSAIQFDMPEVSSAEDASEAARAVLAAVANGDITPSEGSAAMALVEGFRRTLELTELERRIAALEGQQ